MGDNYYFVEEKSNGYKLKVFTVFSFMIIISIIILLVLFQTFKDAQPGSLRYSIKDDIKSEIINYSLAGIFYSGFIGGLFFIPLPQEVFFYFGLFKGNSIIYSIIAIMSGYILSQLLNYYIGAKLHKPFMSFISKKKLYKTRRYTNKYGPLSVFLFNFLPLPAPLLTFALGIARYNIYRLFFYITLGSLLKYFAMILFFFLTT